MWIIPITLPPEEVHVQADRRLVFQVLTAFGATAPDGEASTRVLREEDDRVLVEFRTPIRGLFNRRKVYTTVEWVTPREPDRIDSQGVKGPMPFLRDRFELEEWGECTQFRYRSTFGLHGWRFGWLIGMLYVRPVLRRFVRRHLIELKEIAETRAGRSKVFPQGPCPIHEASDAVVA